MQNLETGVKKSPIFPFSYRFVDQDVERGVWERINEIDLSRVKQKLCFEKLMSSEQADSAIDGYRIFLFLVYRARQEGKTVVPFKLVDKVWHSHILQSIEMYRSEIYHALGFNLDHVAGLPGDVPNPKAVQMSDMISSCYVPMSVHNSDHAGCDGGSMCEADF